MTGIYWRKSVNIQAHFDETASGLQCKQESCGNKGLFQCK